MPRTLYATTISELNSKEKRPCAWINKIRGAVGVDKDGKGKHPSQYLNDLEEWSEHQYDPGYYIGGRTIPQLKNALQNKGSRKKLGFALLLFGMLSSIPAVASFPMANAFLFLIFTLSFVASGLKLLLSKSTGN
jgi:hypothetical protein